MAKMKFERTGRVSTSALEKKAHSLLTEFERAFPKVGIGAKKGPGKTSKTRYQPLSKGKYIRYTKAQKDARNKLATILRNLPGKLSRLSNVEHAKEAK